MKKILLALGLMTASCTVFAGSAGVIEICRAPGITGSQDNKEVSIPAGSTFTGACDSNGEHCRSGIVLTTTETTSMSAVMSLCSIVKATVTSTDGKPIPRNEPLLPQWSIAGFTPQVFVAKAFK